MNLIFVIIAGFIITVYAVDVRLTDGQGENQGRVEVRRNELETWGSVCDLNFGQEEASVVCRQLHYRYSRNESGVYIPRVPDYRLENFKCNGNESEFGECIEAVWKTNTGLCGIKSNSYAGVCCSNSPEFGELYDDVFVSHCADDWIDAEETCETKMATLASFDEYKAILGSRDKQNNGDVNGEKGFWTKSFFTPWIWSNGCFQFHKNSFDLEEFNLRNNTAQACLQLCSIASVPSSFLISETFCRCIPTESLKSYITEVLPGNCNMRCAGDSNYYCGAGAYWSMYTLESEDTFFKITDPAINERGQCAVLVASRRLATENCFKRYGYICGQISVDNVSFPQLMFFKNSRFYEVFMIEARRMCTDGDASMRLMGSQILEPDIFMFTEFGHLWVDISRLLTDVYTVYWEPTTRSNSSVWRNLKPKWCMSARLRGMYYSDEITSCQQNRFRYICSINREKHQIPNTTGSSGSNSTDETGMVKTVVVAAVCGVLLVIVLIIVICLYRRSSTHGHSCICCKKEQEKQGTPAPQRNYTASFHVTDTSPEHIYSEIRGTEDHVYQEADNLLDPDKTVDATDTSVALNDIEKEPVTIKRSYSSPKDLATLVDGSDTHDFKDPSYIYPYDKVARSESNAPYDKVARSESNANSAEIETLTPQLAGDNELTEHRNKHNKQDTAV